MGVFLVLYILGTMYTIARVQLALVNLERFSWESAVIVISVLAIANIPRCIFAEKPNQGFASSVVAIRTLVALFGLALFPNLVTASNDPRNRLTVYNASSSEGTLWVLLGIAMIGMPFVLTYTAVILGTCRGRVELGEHSY